MAWTQTEIDTLKAAMAQGTLRVRYGDRDVTYRSLAEMKEILGDMQSEVDATAGTRRARKVIFQASRGL